MDNNNMFEPDSGICLAEQIRAKNIEENRREMVRLGLIEDKVVKRDIKKKIKPLRVHEEPTRRSSRKRSSVDYSSGIDQDWEEEFGRKINSKRGKENQPPRRSSRKKSVVNYALMDPNMDSKIFCDLCDDYVDPPCTVHGELMMKFKRLDELQLEVGPSQLRRAGDGLWNRGADIPVGTMLGPYKGTFVTIEEYKRKEKEGKESGYAWLIRDSETMEVPVGYVDPGNASDPRFNILAKANCPNQLRAQNMVGVQYEGQIYYRVVSVIYKDTEIFVDYGREYAKELGINTKKWATYTRREDHTSVAVPCPKCNTFFASQQLMEEHVSGVNGAICRGKMDGKKKCPSSSMFACFKCNATFTTRGHFNQHNESIHEGKCYPCEDHNCSRVFNRKENMTRHYREVHLKEKNFKCPTCGVTFTQKANLSTHINAVHLLKKSFKCSEQNCNVSFSLKHNLTKHIRTVHLKERKFICSYPDCGHSSGRLGDLKKHIAAFHLLKKPFTCPYSGCTYSAAQKKDLNRHRRRIHSVEVVIEKIIDDVLNEICLPYQCEVDNCFNRYVTAIERDRHMERLH